MKLLFDQNISHRILKNVSAHFPNSTSVKDEALIDASDKEIWAFAKQQDFTIVTQDSDFNELNSLYGFPPKVIWIRTGNLNTEALATVLIDHFSDLTTFLLDDRYGCFEIIKIGKG